MLVVSICLQQSGASALITTWIAVITIQVIKGNYTACIAVCVQSSVPLVLYLKVKVYECLCLS